MCRVRGLSIQARPLVGSRVEDWGFGELALASRWRDSIFYGLYVYGLHNFGQVLL